jgi:hypothetical protein
MSSFAVHLKESKTSPSPIIGGMMIYFNAHLFYPVGAGLLLPIYV